MHNHWKQPKSLQSLKTRCTKVLSNQVQRTQAHHHHGSSRAPQVGQVQSTQLYTVRIRVVSAPAKLTRAPNLPENEEDACLLLIRS